MIFSICLQYSSALLRSSAASGHVRVCEHCAEVADTVTVTVTTGEGEGTSTSAVTTLVDGHVIESDFVVLATGGLFLHSSLVGVMNPCWSYLVSIPEPAAATATAAAAPHKSISSPHSPNFFTWGFTHDWCLTNGHMRVSGEDHFSALKAPRMDKRCASLADWTYGKYPYLAVAADGGEVASYGKQYGIYSETPDKLPLVGLPNPASRVCYLLGCNAWGQASLSYAASLVPGILGFAELDGQQRESLNLLSIQRFPLLPIVKEN